jgi:tight adherence protein B
MAAVVPTVAASIVGRQRSAKLEEELPDVLQVIASSLRAGHSFLQALDSATTEVPEPSASEFGRVLSEVRLGRDAKEALEAMAQRVRSDDLGWAVLAISIQREVGGNLAEVLDTLAETMRERMAVRRQVKVLSAEGRLSMIVLFALPLGLGAYMAIVNPKYLGLLFSTQLGLVMLATAGCLMTLGMFWMRKVVKIDV